MTAGRNVKTADIIIALIILVPIFLFSLKMVIDLNQKPNILNMVIYSISISSIITGIRMRDIAESKQNKGLWILGLALAALGIFATQFLALFILKDLASLAFTALILIPLLILTLAGNLL